MLLKGVGEKRGEGQQKLKKEGGGQAESKGGCLKEADGLGGWNPFTNYATFLLPFFFLHWLY